MCEKGYSVLRAKQEIRQTQEAALREKAEATKEKLYDYKATIVQL